MSRAREAFDELAGRAGLGNVPPRALAAIALVAGIAVVWAIARSGGGGAEEFGYDEAAGAAIEASAEASAAASPVVAPESVETSVVVHVAGAVRSPGIVRLLGGSRVSDAVDAAGGALGNAGLDAVNLARVLADGEQIYVPTLDEVATGAVAAPSAPGADGGAGGEGSSAPGLVDINSASAAQLEELPGVGPATAAKIVEDREANGPFAAIEDLMRVTGIGPKKYEALSALIEAR